MMNVNNFKTSDKKERSSKSN